MNKLHQKLHLQHYRHTGKLLKHHHTSYPALMVLLVIAATTMIGVSLAAHAAADSLVNLYGTAPVDIPSTPASITNIAEGSTMTDSGMIAAGGCPLVSPQAVVAVEVDGVNAGSSICDSSNNFVVPLIVAPGPHSLVATTYTINGDKGASSAPLHVTYSPASAASPNTLAVIADSPLSYLGADKTATWAGKITGGTPPYHITADWGDNHQNTYTVSASGERHFSHRYASLRSRNVTFVVTDATSKAMRKQFAAVAYSIASAPANSLVSSTGSNASSNTTTIGLYGLLLTLLSVCGIAWIEAEHSKRHPHVPGTVHYWQHESV